MTPIDRDPEVRDAGFLYLVCTRASTLCLLALFALYWAATGSLELSPATAAAIPLAQQSAIFVLALAGFGLKAGLMPLHVWLPPAHAAAPSHVSALMSGVLIKIGIYGLRPRRLAASRTRRSGGARSCSEWGSSPRFSASRSHSRSTT